MGWAEQIDEYGIGNGISLLIMASIVAQMPQALLDLRGNMTAELSGSSGEIGPDKLIVLAALFVAVVFGVVFITMGQLPHPDAEPRNMCAVGGSMVALSSICPCESIKRA